MTAASTSARSQPAAFAAVTAALMLAGCSPPAVMPAANAPTLKARSLAELPTPLPRPYDETATPEAVSVAIDRAFEVAKRTDKRVIVGLGGNWCSWCRSLSAAMALPEAKPFIESNFVVVNVPVSATKDSLDRNLEVLDRFKIDAVGGVPWLIVAEADGTVLSSSAEVTAGENPPPQAMINWLAKWAKRPATDSSEGRRV